MAINPFVYQNMQNANGLNLASQGIESYQKQLADQAQNINGLGASLQANLGNIADSADIRANTDAQGNIDEAGYIRSASLRSPMYGLLLKQLNDQKTISDAKTLSEVAKNNAAAMADNATKQMNNIKTTQSVISGVANQISQSTPETWDAAVANAKKMAAVYGIELPDAFSSGYSEDKKQLAMGMAMSQKERIDADHQALQGELQKINTENDTKKTNSSIVKDLASINQGERQLNISERNADTTALNAKTGIANAETSRMNAVNTANSNKNAKIEALTKSYNTDLDNFTKAKQDYIEKSGGATVKLNKTNSAIELAQRLLDTIQRDPSIIGSPTSKIATGVTQATGYATESNNFKENLKQIASNFNLDSMKQMKGYGQISDADMRMISSAGGLNPDGGKSSAEYAKSLREFINNAQLSNKADSESLTSLKKSLQDKSEALKKRYGNN